MVARFVLLLVVYALSPMMACSQDSIPRPEHPRPDFERDEWINLNGTWEFAETNDPAADFLTAAMPDKITVPFCRESELSGLARKGFVDYVWYRRTFEVPSGWKGSRILFHVGACDYETTAWVNGIQVGFHRGSSDAFYFDITKALIPGANTVVLKVYDNVRSGLQPAGKQARREESHGIFYTRTTGIWQTVWLESVPETAIENFFIVPKLNQFKPVVEITVRVDGDPRNHHVRADLMREGRVDVSAESPLGWRETQLEIPLQETRLWSPEDPFLYGVRLSLRSAGDVIDEVSSYVGLRTVEIQGRAILINGQPVFQRLVLDQGFYPDGIWTASSDAALKRDIEMSMEAGFNGARLHQKVFEPRFLYHADKLGYLVWGEFPNFGMNCGDPRIDEPVVREWTSIVERDRNHPAIVGWCPFNETDPDAGRIQNLIVDLTHRIDPTRPCLDTSGWTHTHSDPDLLDGHDYDQDPETYRARWDAFFTQRWRIPDRYGIPSGPMTLPYFVSEFGGIGWNLQEGWGYGNTPESLEDWYVRFEGLVNANLDNPNFFGYCYTQLTNVEQEQNGIFTYDRQPKFDNAKLKAIQTRAAAYESNPPLDSIVPPKTDWRVLVPTAHDRDLESTWRCTTTDPGEGWQGGGFDDSAWQSGQAGFGDRAEHLKGTDWSTPDIWLRKQVEYDGTEFDAAVALIFHDDATSISLNGTEIWKRRRWTNAYEVFDLTEAFKKHLKPGTNTFAVHTHQNDGGQYIDVGVLLGKVGE